MQDNGASKFLDASLEDLIADPSKYGAPTFDEFVKNREKYIGREDEVLESVERGSKLLSKHRVKHKYVCLGFECSTLSEVEKVLKNEGYSVKNVELIPQLKNENDQIIIETNFVPKESKSGLIVS